MESSVATLVEVWASVGRQLRSEDTQWQPSTAAAAALGSAAITSARSIVHLEISAAACSDDLLMCGTAAGAASVLRVLLPLVPHSTGNPCTNIEGYRMFVITVLPQLQQLDGKHILPSERTEARQHFAQVRRVIEAKAAEEELLPEVESESDSEDEEQPEPEPSKFESFGKKPVVKPSTPGIEKDEHGRVRQCNQGDYKFQIDEGDEEVCPPHPHAAPCTPLRRLRPEAPQEGTHLPMPAHSRAVMRAGGARARVGPGGGGGGDLEVPRHVVGGL